MKLLSSIFFVASLLFLSAASADPLPTGFHVHEFNGKGDKVTTADGETTFQIFDKQCGKVIYDGRGENDCINGTVRAQAYYLPNATVGQTLEYKFDIWVDPSLQFQPVFTPDAQGYEPGGVQSQLRVLGWQGTFLHDSIYWLKLDATNGLTFEAQTCQPAKEFGQWVTFSMKVHWAGDNTGWVKVSCNDKVIYAKEDFASNRAPSCYIQNTCNSSVIKDTKEILVAAGLVSMGYGYSWKETGHTSPFLPIQKNGITLKMRNMSVTSGAVLYDDSDTGAVKDLQTELKTLGCYSGEASGEPDQPTRDAALSCKAFPDNALPTVFNVATLRTFVDLYKQADVATLPAGALPVPLPQPNIIVHASEMASNDEGPGIYNVEFIAHAEINQPKGVVGHKDADVPNQTYWSMMGRFIPKVAAFVDLQLIMADNLDKKTADAVSNCSVEITKFKDGTSHAILHATTGLKTYFIPHADCVIKALPPDAAFNVDMVTHHFQDIAIGLFTEGTIKSVTQPGLAAFLEKVARGTVSIRG